MLFSSPIFLFAFLPVFLVVYHLAPNRWQSAVILFGSCVFYGWWKLSYLIVVLGMALLSFLVARSALRTSPSRQRGWVVLGVSVNILLLCYFKYTFFITSNLAQAGLALGVEGVPTWEVLLPIGISFLTFQSISYILDVTRRDVPEARNIVDYLAFMTLFPQLIAGPILRYKDLAGQFRQREKSLRIFNEGLQRFILGLAMKLIIADSVAPLADRLFALSDPTLAEAWLAAISYAIQLFFDFAGYSAMAVGLGLMMGFRFVENFNKPYHARSITEFWQRWHISLSNWLRDYVYVPLGGNRAGTTKTLRNLVLTMLLGGIWHGANWTFVVWGAWHGGLMALERALGIKGKRQIIPGAFAWPVTMVLVLIGWVVFRAESLSQAMSIYAGMLGLNGLGLRAETIVSTQSTELAFLALGTALVAPLPSLRGVRVPQSISIGASCFLFVASFSLMHARSDSPFLYFQF
ncbi:MBOAT family O-acyltransferase [Roseobacter sp. MH60115]|uniref:MBOAT family O-acyltransferase n=1 Tax=Roseobacter sp. MH60115 TaxID=2785324 RepID=UPI0018A2A9D4|nr:MBOAT family protein [Roseobacter sp. MH60115]